MSKEKKLDKKVNRRDFLKGAGILGAFAFAAPLFTDPLQQLLGDVWIDDLHGVGNFTQDYTAANVLYTTCEQCNTHCTIKTFVMEGKKNQQYSSLVRKIAGNPYSPINMVPYNALDYSTPIAAAAAGFGSVAVDGRGFRGGRTCLKGQAGIQTAYDATRIRTPLKRVGPRGSGKWISVTWEQAIEEIVNGSNDLGTPGLKSMWAYIPQEVVMADWEKVNNKEMTFEDFDRKYKEVLIDTKHPDFGPKANQIVNLSGNRREFVRQRIWEQGFGSINSDDHGGVCGVTHVTGNIRSFELKKKKKRMYPDLDHVEFMIAWGTNPVVANKGPTWLAPKITNAKARGMKMAVIDTRMSKTAEKADIWVPIEPGMDGALALAMGRWIIENKRYDERYLRNPNKDAATLDNEPTWSDATHLINVSDPKRQKLRASDLGLGTEEEFVVLQNGVPTLHSKAAEGDLEVDTTINGIRVKSSFTLYKERVMEKTIKEYASMTGIAEEQIILLAKEFTSYGKKAAIMSYRGVAMNTNGYYNTRAINMLNHLIGNYDWKGGSITTGKRFSEMKGRYELLKVPKANKAWGIPISRRQTPYEKTSLFKTDGGYPAQRPWFPYAGSTSHEVIPSAAEGYPYSLKALFIHRMSPVLSMPGGHNLVEILKDTKKIPLFVANDIVIGETSMYADYLLPDLSYLERFGQETIYPNQLHKISSVMQPVTRVIPQARPVEDMYIDILKKMNMPGVGQNAFPDGSSLDSYEDFYLKMVANIAFDGEKPVPDATVEEIQLFEETRKKALGKYFNHDVWKKAVKPEEWKKVVYVLNRGGRFEAPGSEYVGEHVKYQLADQVNFYDEGVAKGKNSFTGEFFDGIPQLNPVKNYEGDEVKSDKPLKLINWKARHMGTHRNINDTWLREIRPSNPLWMNPFDADRRGLKNGDKIRIVANHHTVEGEVFVTNGIRPGTVGAEFNFGHYAYGSAPVQIDSYWTKTPAPYGNTKYNFFEPGHEESGYALGRNTGFSINSLLDLDPILKNNGLVDLIGGGASQYDTRVEVVKR